MIVQAVQVLPVMGCIIKFSLFKDLEKSCVQLQSTCRKVWGNWLANHKHAGSSGAQPCLPQFIHTQIQNILDNETPTCPVPVSESLDGFVRKTLSYTCVEKLSDLLFRIIWNCNMNGVTYPVLTVLTKQHNASGSHRRGLEAGRISLNDLLDP